MAMLEVDIMAGTVKISVAEYESLVDTALKFLSLRQALLAGGATTETVDVLISANFPPKPHSEDTSSTREDGSGAVPIPATRSSVPGAHSTKSTNPDQRLPRFGPLIPQTPDDTDEGDMPEEQAEVSRNRHVKRSLAITGLSPVTTLHSVAQVLKGGDIFQMHIRYRNCSAHVSFVDPAAAHSFLRYAQTNDIYIQGKKVTVAWDHNRQSWMRPSLAKCIESLRATRNLVIRYVGPNMTADSIREDLDHIHGLEVVNLFFEDGHAYISLNSIRSALTARNCMLSRLKYKRLKIAFYPDECAQPLPPASISPSQKLSDFRPAGISHQNRFEVLDESQEG
ncbi:uncharacterized protein Z519_07829 [Cladophialophora bantiana CBS 173.52]|uniref:RRM domain-containing protein n=1 Tax=Cladophialophora bantiana (strain ATCC 10958 / CBS 173.52 / CDC B-1940 / NIH 8579) TaxID=1442370 RepID=A0A0D2I4P4_CLAB1|nr:uncharacterized protein Z519_07829 [Cladophialophora bantiana CBS 173.52]KIW91859.1 hypothetical protein Z519_07829 [Cladophialophora bantiana CBS 173.52]